MTEFKQIIGRGTRVRDDYGKLYFTNESGVTTVLAAGPEFKVLATNELDDSYTLSSLAVAGSQLFLRTGTHLYCIGDKAAN